MASYEMNRFSLTFADGEVERDYRADFDEKNRVFYLLGVILSVVGWLSVIFDANIYKPDQTGLVALLICTFLMPLFLFIIVVVAARRLTPFHQALCALANLAAGLLIIYIAHYVLETLTLTVSFVICVAFFAFFVLRLRFTIAVPIVSLYMLGLELALIDAPHMPAADVQSLQGSIPMLLGVCIAGGYALERSSRQIFVQARTIEQQKKTIEAAHERSEQLLLNILPPEIAARLTGLERCPHVRDRVISF